MVSDNLGSRKDPLNHIELNPKQYLNNIQGHCSSVRELQLIVCTHFRSFRSLPSVEAFGFKRLPSFINPISLKVIQCFYLLVRLFESIITSNNSSNLIIGMKMWSHEAITSRTDENFWHSEKLRGDCSACTSCSVTKISTVLEEAERYRTD